MRFLKEMKWDGIMMGVLNILLGIVALVLPETMERTLAFLIGAVLILAGAVSMICYLIRDAYQNYYHNDFLYGLLGVALGCVVLYKVEIVIGMISVLLGFLVLVSGFTKLQAVIDMKRLAVGNWVVMLAFAAINVILGLVLVCRPFEAADLLFRVLGIGLIVSGAADVAVTVFFAHRISEYLKAQEAVEQAAVSVQDDVGEEDGSQEEQPVDWDK